MKVENNGLPFIKKNEIQLLISAVDEFAEKMKGRLIEKHVGEAYRGWNDPKLKEKIEFDLHKQLSNDIRDHKEVDIANRAMFLYFLHKAGVSTK